MHPSKSRLFFISIIVSTPLFIFTACSIPKNGNLKSGDTTFSPILVNRYFAEVELGMEQVSNSPQLAIEYFNSAIEKNLNRPEAFVGRGVARMNMKKWVLAIQDFDLALEADWKANWKADNPFQEMLQGWSYVHLCRATASIGFLGTIDAKEDKDTYILTLGKIHIDFEMAERHAGAAGDHELIKQIIQTRHLFDKQLTLKKP